MYGSKTSAPACPRHVNSTLKFESFLFLCCSIVRSDARCPSRDYPSLPAALSARLADSPIFCASALHPPRPPALRFSRVGPSRFRPHSDSEHVGVPGRRYAVAGPGAQDREEPTACMVQGERALERKEQIEEANTHAQAASVRPFLPHSEDVEREHENVLAMTERLEKTCQGLPTFHGHNPAPDAQTTQRNLGLMQKLSPSIPLRPIPFERQRVKEDRWEASGLHTEQSSSHSSAGC